MEDLFSTKICGRAWLFGNDIDTDQIYPGKYLPLTDKSEMAKHAMEGTERGEVFLKEVKPGDIIITMGAGDIFQWHKTILKSLKS